MKNPTHHPTVQYYIIAGVAVLAVVLWSIIPPSSIALNEACRPSGLHASISAMISSDAFWSNQRDALDEERYDLLSLQNNGEANSKETSGIEQRMERMSDRDQQRATEIQERKRVLQEKRKMERLERLGWLIKCTTVAAKH